jgi:methyl-accepting chemotaxis protein
MPVANRAGSMEQLAKATAEIGKVVELIATIARQTTRWR